MLKRDRFQTETPNVIDPGECPPSRPNLKAKDEILTQEGETKGIMRGPALQRFDKSGIRHSLYTRKGNKGALAKGIPLRFVLGLDGDDNDNDNDDDDHSDGFSDEHEIVFEKSSNREVPFSFEDSYNHNKSTKHRRNRFTLQDDDDDDEEENGIAQARLFAAAMLNESEKRSHRDLLGFEKSRPTFRHMMHRASSFRKNHHPSQNSRTAAMASARASSFRSLGRSSSHQSIPIDSNSNRSISGKIIKDEKEFRNIWLVDETRQTKLSRKNLLWKKLTCSIVGLMVTIFAITIFGVVASRSQPSMVSEIDNSKTRVPLTSDQRLEHIVHYLGENTGISSLEDLTNPSSPQAMAARWLAHEDSEKLEVPTIGTGWADSNGIPSPFDFVQRYVLLVFYFALGGDAWTNVYHFASPDRHECSWFERFLDTDPMILETNANRGEDGSWFRSSVNETNGLLDRNDRNENSHYFAMGVACDRDLRVKSIFLPSNDLKGSIPSEIQYLSALHSLNLESNSLEGSIPEEIQNLGHLNGLDLSGNRLTGDVSPIYSWIGKQWAHLEILDLSDNQLALGGQNITHIRRAVGGENRLQTLALGGNAPNSSAYISIPDEIRYFTNLRELYLDDSDLGGRIPAWVFYELPKLQFLDLSNNHLTGSISGEFPSMNPLQNLEFLLLHNNPLTGTLPESIGAMSSLNTVTIHHTNMTVGSDAANHICWLGEESSALESLTTDCGDASCPCCIENCCEGKDCYPDVDWHSGVSNSARQQPEDNRSGNDN